MTDKEFFTSEMNKALENCRNRVINMGGDAHDVGIFVPIETAIYGSLGTGSLYAMADALLSMPMTSWEAFYRGYSDWARDLPERKLPLETVEENARGAMLMALKNRIDDLQWQVTQAAA